MAVLEALGYALFARDDSGELRAVGRAPEWLRALWPALAEAEAVLPLAEASPFLENFLIDAEEIWRKDTDERAQSGPWIETPAQGDNVELEATALNVDGRSLLLINCLGEEFAAKKDVLQKARETVIAHQRLNSEMQKKEILLHCVADEMSTALANIVTSLRLIEGESNPPRTKVLLGLANRGAEDQQRLIARVLSAFSEEIGGIYGRTGAERATAAWGAVLQDVLEQAEAAFAERRIPLHRPTRDPARSGRWRVMRLICSVRSPV